MIDTQTKLRIVELRAGGKSMAKIAEEVGVAKQTVVDVCNDMKEEIASLHAMQLEALYEEQKISTEEGAGEPKPRRCANRETGRALP